MSQFCTVCENLLVDITTSEEYYRKCLKCHVTYDVTDSDSMRLEDIRGTNLIIYQTILQNAGKDPVNPKVKKQCIKCPNNILRQTRVGINMQLINICTKCDFKWLDSN
jgi:hypothetical protein